ncbi:MAG: hypothetical protein JJU29_02955 [Verrucomicrobia bacterium]|nr:hypothetical protein [Verrucomicrobiota bacterium]MCH8511132.1 hypothetical protein [Kiritimatiellia bacterium]
MITPRSPIQAHPYRPLELVFFGLCAFLASLAVSHWVFQGERVSPDEGGYLFQAWNFFDGVVRREVPPFDGMMDHEAIVLRPEHGWLSRLPPGHSLWLVPGLWLNHPHIMTALAAAITVMAGYEIGRRLRIPRFLVPVVFLISPFFLLLHGTLLSQTSGMAFSSLMLLGYMVWRQDRKPFWGFVAGLCWSFLYLNRPLTAWLIFIPFAVDAWLELARNRKYFSAWLGLLLFAMALAVGVGLYLRYNELSTGDPRLASHLFDEPGDKLGFGFREMRDGTPARVEHTVQRGFRLLWRNVRNLDQWMLGTPRFTLLIWLGLAGHGWSRRWSGILFGCLVSVLLGHVAWWRMSDYSAGPLYLAEIFPHFVVLGSLGLSRIWRRSHAHASLRLGLFVLAALLVLWHSLVFCRERVDRIEDLHGEAWALERQIKALPEPSLLLIDGTFPQNPQLRSYIGLNPRGLETAVLRVQVPPEDQPAIAAGYPERQAFILVDEPEVRIDPFETPFTDLMRPGSGGRSSRGVGEISGEHRVADGRNAAGLLFYGWYPILPPGDYEVRFDMRWRDVSTDAPVRIEVVTDYGRVLLGEQEISGGLDPSGVSFQLLETTQVEPRVHFGGSGTLELRKIEIKRRGPVGLDVNTLTEETEDDL